MLVPVETCSSLAQHMNSHTKEFFGTIFFIVGSMIFVIAVFFNAMKLRDGFDGFATLMVSMVSHS